MSAVTGRSLRKTLRQLSAPKVLTVQIALGVVTIILSWTTGWQATVVGLVLMHVVTTLASLGPWGGRPAPGPTRASKAYSARLERRIDKLGVRLASKAQLTRLEGRVDGLGARLVASTERTRVEVLDALAQSRIESEEQSS